jgi:hypothetical protein
MKPYMIFERLGLAVKEYQHPTRGMVRTLDYPSRNTVYITEGLRKRREDKGDNVGAIKESKMSAKDYGPSVTVCRLYRKQSKNGAMYMVGRWGGARVTLLKSNKVAEDGGEIYNLLISQAPEKPKDANAVKSDDAYRR